VNLGTQSPVLTKAFRGCPQSFSANVDIVT
jgi:hypothetical protein